MTWKYLRFANFVVGVVGIILRVGSCGITLIPVQDGLNPNSIGIDVGGITWKDPCSTQSRVC